MGMLMYHQRQKQRQAEAEAGTTTAPRKRRQRSRKAPAPVVPEGGSEPQTPASAYSELTDEQLEQAYTIMVDGSSYPGREDAIRALDAVDADGDGKRDDQQD